MNAKVNSANSGVKINELQMLKALESVISTRLRYATALGETYGGDRDLYQVLGYKTELQFSDYFNMFDRGDIGKVLIQKIPKACWMNAPTITDEKEDSTFEKEVSLFIKKFNLFSVFYRGDQLTRIGEYGIIFMGFNDVSRDQLNTEVIKGNKNLELLYLQPFSQNSVTIYKVEDDFQSPRYGLPLIYQIKFASKNSEAENTVLVHHSRVLHLAEDVLENPIIGTPALKNIYNRLEDLQKILGGSGEMFWRNAVPGKVAKAKEGYQFGPTAKEDLQTQMDEYEHNLRRMLTLEGIDLETLSVQAQSPKDFLDAQLTMISIVTGIPKRILMGTERGELASTQDQNTWNNLINERQNDLCGPQYLKPFLDYMIELGILPEPQKGEYTITWPEISVIGPKDESEIGLNRMRTLREYVSAPGADVILPTDIFLRDELNYSVEQIDEIKQILGDLFKDVPEIPEDTQTPPESGENGQGEEA